VNLVIVPQYLSTFYEQKGRSRLISSFPDQHCAFQRNVSHAWALNSKFGNVSAPEWSNLVKTPVLREVQFDLLYRSRRQT
jgi:hypothetical protein